MGYSPVKEGSLSRLLFTSALHHSAKFIAEEFGPNQRVGLRNPLIFATQASAFFGARGEIKSMHLVKGVAQSLGPAAFTSLLALDWRKRNNRPRFGRQGRGGSCLNRGADRFVWHVRSRCLRIHPQTLLLRQVRGSMSSSIRLGKSLVSPPN
jgi:hypothetical protein